jgi:hypothetical protein
MRSVFWANKGLSPKSFKAFRAKVLNAGWLKQYVPEVTTDVES